MRSTLVAAHRSVVLLVVFVAVLLASSWGALPAQSAGRPVRLELDEGALLGQVERLGSAHGRIGGYTWIDVSVRNLTRDARTATLEVELSGRVESRTVELEAGWRAEERFPVQFGHGAVTVTMSTGGVSTALYSQTLRALGHAGNRHPRPDPTLVCGLIGPRLNATTWKAALVPHVSKDVVVEPIEPMLPERWWLASGFDVLIVDGADPAIDPGLQRRIERFVVSGGGLLVTDPEKLVSGPIADLFRRGVQGSPEMLGHGLGWFARAEEGAAGVRLAPSLSLQGFHDAGYARLGSGWQHPLVIPGVGGVPIVLFVLLMVLFVVVAGPLNYIWLWKQRSFSHLVWTVPALGSLATVLVVLVAVARDGFSSRASVQTLTHLDQVTHRAVVKTRQSLFMAVTPSGVRPHPGSMFVVPDISRFGLSRLGRRGELRRHEDGSWSGPVIQPRRSSPLLATTMRSERARMRFRREGATCEVLPDAGLVPADRGLVLLRDLDGVFWSGAGGDGVVRRVTAVGDPLREAARSVTLRFSESWSRSVQNVDSASGLGFVHPLVGGMPPGSYLAVVERPPWTETFGLDPVIEEEFHLVFGLLAEEDLDG